jgi:hypothetical protein
MELFYSFFNWFRRWMFSNSPQIPWRWGYCEGESLFEDRHTRPLGLFLQIFEPQLLMQWFASVAPASAEARKAAIALDDLRERKSELGVKLADLQAQYVDKSSSKDDSWEWLLTVGLSLMLFFGIAQILHIDNVANLNPKKLPLFSLALIGAICLTAGAKLMVIYWVKATRSYEPTRTFLDDERHANIVAWWWRVFYGDSAVWLSIAVVVLEIAFAGTGLVRLLPRHLRQQLLIEVSAFIGAGIAALINVGLAWGKALEEIRLHKEYLTARSQEQELARRQAEVLKVTLKEVTREVEKQERFVKHLRELAQHEHERWESAVKRCYRRWYNAEPKRLQRFKEFYSQLNHNEHVDTNNGKQIMLTKN